MEPMIVKATEDDDGVIFVQALGGPWEGVMSHGATLEEAFKNFGEAAALYDEVARKRNAPAPERGEAS